jgi:hypothetical protein
LREKNLLIIDLIRTVYGDLKHSAGNRRILEDVYFGITLPKFFDWFTVPAPDEAMYFALEVAPSHGYELMAQQIPFGCHAWQKYEPDFWERIVETAIDEKPGQLETLEGLFSIG